MNTTRFKWDVLSSQIDIHKFPKLLQSVFGAKSEFVCDVYQFQGISFLLVCMKYHHVVQSVLWHIRTQIRIEAPHRTKRSLAYSIGSRHDDNKFQKFNNFTDQEFLSFWQSFHLFEDISEDFCAAGAERKSERKGF